MEKRIGHESWAEITANIKTSIQNWSAWSCMFCKTFREGGTWREWRGELGKETCVPEVTHGSGSFAYSHHAMHLVTGGSGGRTVLLVRIFHFLVIQPWANDLLRFIL